MLTDSRKKRKQMTKPVLIWLLVFSLVLPLGFGAGSGAYAAGEDMGVVVSASGVESIQAVTSPGRFGNKLSAVIVEYSDDVDNSKLSLESFELLVEFNNLTQGHTAATIAKVYANDAAEMTSKPVNGRYVIVETDPMDGVGYMSYNTSYYYNDGGTMRSRSWVRTEIPVKLTQMRDVYSIAGDVIAAAGPAQMPASKSTRHLGYEKLKHVFLTDEMLGADLAGFGVQLFYYLPENYSLEKEYPVVLFCHGTGECYSNDAISGLSLGVDNLGAGVTTNLLPYTWMDTNEVIFVAPQYINGNNPSDSPAGYDRDRAVGAAFDYVYSGKLVPNVDNNRFYVTGTSQGAGDNISNPRIAKAVYNAMNKLHVENGKTEAWITDNLRYTEMPNQVYIDLSEPSYHSSIKPTYHWYAYYSDAFPYGYDPLYGANDPGGYSGMIDWVLSKNKADKEPANAVDLEAYVMGLAPGLTTEYTNNTISMTADYSKPLVWPLTGFFEYKFTQGVIDAAGSASAPLPGITKSLFNSPALLDRTVKFYIPKNISLNTYMYIIARPDTVTDVYAWLVDEGWIKMAETYGEALIILEPSAEAGNWGTAQEEAAYIAACLNEAWADAGTADDPKAATTGGIAVCSRVPFSNGKTLWFLNGHPSFYCVGYGNGSPVLESWTAANPLYVVSQAFIDGDSVGSATLSASGAQLYKGTTASGQANLTDAQLAETIASINENGGFGEVSSSDGNTVSGGTGMLKSSIPVPTLLVGGSYSDSADYWKGVNDVKSKTAPDITGNVGGSSFSVFKQKNDSLAWTTEHANRNIRRWNTGVEATYGVSEVRVVDDYGASGMKAESIRGFLADYTGYTSVWAYSRYLVNRLDYLSATKKAREAIDLDNPVASYKYDMFTAVRNADNASNPVYTEETAEDTVQLLSMESTRVKAPNTPEGSGEGTVYSVMLAYKDYMSGRGLNPLELNPRESIIYVPDCVDLTKDVPLVFVHPGGSAAALRFMDAPGLWSLANDEGIALAIVGNQHRGGSMDVGYDGLTRDNANYILAVLKLLDNAVGDAIADDYTGFAVDKGRTYLTGHSSGCYESLNSAVGPLRNIVCAVGATSRSNEGFHFEAGLMPIYMFMGQNDGGNAVLWGTGALDRWKDKAWAMNGISASFTGSAAATESEFINATGAVYSQFGRHKNYIWNNWQDIPLVRFTRTLAREHNAIPEEFREIWKFVSSFRLDTQTGERYYSPSGFNAAGDETLVLKEPPDTSAKSLNETLLEKTALNAAGTSRSWNSDVIDRSKVIEHPITGFYSHYFPGTGAKGATVAELEGRTFKIYIPERSPVRTYAYVIAVPDGVDDTYKWLDNQGWFDEADKTGEILFILEPDQSTLTWGTPAQEAAYLAACLEENIGNRGNANVGIRDLSRGILGNEAIQVYVEQAYVSGGVERNSVLAFQIGGVHATNYYVGYGEGAKVLESWTSSSPLLVAAQTFIGGDSAGNAILGSNGARTYNGVNDGSYFPGHNQNDFLAVLDSIKTHGGPDLSGKLMTNREVPVPTLLVGDSYRGSDSLAHWMLVNDALPVADADGVYWQDIGSGAWTTDYANKNIKKWYPAAKYGVSQVRLGADAEIARWDAPSVHSFLAQYTRFTWQFAYSNHLNYRLDYFEAARESREAAELELAKRDTFATFKNLAGNDARVELHASVGTHVTVPNKDISEGGMVHSVIFAFQDYDNNGTLDGRQAIIYEPDSARDGAPVVFVHPGATHAPITFMDASHWWAVANDEGCVIVVVGEHNSSSPVSLGHNGTENFDRSLLQLLKEDKVGLRVKLDYGRVYASGHSAGCSTAINLALTTESYFAAVAGTSAAPTNFVTTADMMPAYLLVGGADISESAHDLVAEPWETRGPTGVGKPNMFIKNTLAMNGVDAAFVDGDEASLKASTSDWRQDGRYISYRWDNRQGVPMVKFTRTLAREHNCYPEEFRLAWDFLKTFSTDTATGMRYYSESGFAADDAIIIYPDVLRLGVNAEAESDIGKNVEFFLHANIAEKLLTVEAEVMVDGNMLAGVGVEPLNGFTLMNDIFWGYAGGGMWKGTVTLAYPAGGDEGFTSAVSTNIAKFVFAPRAAGDAT
ncbi:MAG: hypothetical protein FWG42_11435, partial [Clostridiales bacterium]|nr:hypothetical protein [Clostridiales bacterium]